VLNVASLSVIVADPSVVDPSLNVTVPLASGNALFAMNWTMFPYVPVLGFGVKVSASSVAVPAPEIEGVKNTT
jgi:hypothetical protein